MELVFTHTSVAMPDRRPFNDYLRTLSHQSLPSSVREPEHVMRHVHFAASKSFFEEMAGRNETLQCEEYYESFFDTVDLCLLDKNLWLRARLAGKRKEPIWTLKEMVPYCGPLLLLTLPA